MSTRRWAASFVAAGMLSIPGVLAMLLPGESEPNDSSQGVVVLFPVAFLIAIFLCNAVASWVVSQGYVSAPRFSAACSVAATAVALIMAAPAVVIGSFVGLYSFWAAVAAALFASAALALMSLPAAFVWWLIAGQVHNKALKPTARKRAAT